LGLQVFYFVVTRTLILLRNERTSLLGIQFSWFEKTQTPLKSPDLFTLKTEPGLAWSLKPALGVVIAVCPGPSVHPQQPSHTYLANRVVLGPRGLEQVWVSSVRSHTAQDGHLI
jgi:hypothetical protein